MVSLALRLQSLALEHRGKTLVVITVLLAWLLYDSRLEVRELETKLAARPMVQTKVLTKVVRGPTRTVEKIVRLPGQKEIVERVIYKAGDVSTRGVESSERPVCPEPDRPAWIRPVAGVSYSLSHTDLDRVNVGVSLWGRVGVAFGQAVGPRRHGNPQTLSVSFRF